MVPPSHSVNHVFSDSSNSPQPQVTWLSLQPWVGTCCLVDLSGFLFRHCQHRQAHLIPSEETSILVSVTKTRWERKAKVGRLEVNKTNQKAREGSRWGALEDEDGCFTGEERSSFSAIVSSLNARKQKCFICFISFHTSQQKKQIVSKIWLRFHEYRHTEMIRSNKTRQKWRHVDGWWLSSTSRSDTRLLRRKPVLPGLGQNCEYWTKARCHKASCLLTTQR